MPTPEAIQRHVLLAAAIGCGALGFVLHYAPGLDDSGRTYVAGMAWKIGFVLGLGWLAAPQLQRLGWQKLRGTMLVGAICIIVLMAARPRWGALAAAAFTIGTGVMAVSNWIRRNSASK